MTDIDGNLYNSVIIGSQEWVKENLNVSKYNDGLIKEGLSERDRGFWTLHMEVEVGHSNAIFNVMEKHLHSTTDRQLFKEGIQQYLHLMEMYWDGIAAKIKRECHHG